MRLIAHNGGSPYYARHLRGLPLIAAVGGRPDFSAIAFTINGSKFLIGDFIIAAVIFFLVVKPMNAPMARVTRQAEAAPVPPAPPKEETLLAEIRDLLREGRR